MANVFTVVKCSLSVVGGFLSYIVGGFDLLIQTMLILTVLDFVTGVGSSIYVGEFDASKCGKGIVKKIFMYLTVALAVVIQNFIGDAIPIRETVIVFYIVTEGMSNLENIGKVVEYPDALKEIFAKLNGKKNE